MAKLRERMGYTLEQGRLPKRTGKKTGTDATKAKSATGRTRAPREADSKSSPSTLSAEAKPEQ